MRETNINTHTKVDSEMVVDGDKYWGRTRVTAGGVAAPSGREHREDPAEAAALSAFHGSSFSPHHQPKGRS